MTDKYLSTRDICARFRCSSRTIFRWMKRKTNPLPSPIIQRDGAQNLWCAEAVAEWEAREIVATRQRQGAEVLGHES